MKHLLVVPVDGLIYGPWLDWLRRLTRVTGDPISGVKLSLPLLLTKDQKLLISSGYSTKNTC